VIFTAHEIVMIGVLAISIVAILWLLERRNKSAASKIHLDDLLIGQDGKASKAAFVMGGSFIVTTWVIIFQTLNKTLTDTTFAAYVGAWVLPAVTALIKGGSPNATSETTIVSRTVTPPEEKP
jgi:hypothetical protein